MKCTSMFGHKWSKWEDFSGPPKEYPDGKVYRQNGQSRVCARCNYSETTWKESMRESPKADNKAKGACGEGNG